MRITVESRINRTPRVAQVEAQFDISEEGFSRQQWDINADALLSEDWRIGLITGPSGCGKSTVARALFPSPAVWSADLGTWPAKAAVIEGFDAALSIREVTELLSSVGFSSPPAWLRPHAVLSTGQQFRADLARLLACPADVRVMDEFTSVVDRTVAQVGSAAVAKAVRKRGGRFVAVTCHEDVIDWLQPDWVLTPADGKITRRSLQPRPPVHVEVFRTTAAAWPVFARHHYLSHTLNPSAVCFAVEHAETGRPMAFSAWINMLTAMGGKREHRTVVMPDFQGIGVGMMVSSLIASMWRGLGTRATSTTTHPAFIAARKRSKDWLLTRPPSLGAAGGKFGHAATRMTAGFQYIGPPMDPILAAKLLG